MHYLSILLLFAGSMPIKETFLVQSSNKTVHILHMYTTEITGRPYVPGREAVDFAVELINSRDDILNGYTVVIHDKDVEQVSDKKC